MGEMDATLALKGLQDDSGQEEFATREESIRQQEEAQQMKQISKLMIGVVIAIT